MGFAVAIDGPAGAGKSTMAKAVARELGMMYLDTGAMYRTIALGVKEAGLDPSDREAVSAYVKDAPIRVTFSEGVQHMWLGEEDVSAAIRQPEVGNMASIVSAHSEVRSRLVDLQRQIAKADRIILDGRDIGTCVLPDAEVKIYLEADPKVRAQRRTKELLQKGVA